MRAGELKIGPQSEASMVFGYKPTMSWCGRLFNSISTFGMLRRRFFAHSSLCGFGVSKGATRLLVRQALFTFCDFLQSMLGCGLALFLHMRYIALCCHRVDVYVRVHRVEKRNHVRPNCAALVSTVQCLFRNKQNHETSQNNERPHG
jgi:hypothetical protein